MTRGDRGNEFVDRLAKEAAIEMHQLYTTRYQER